MTLRAALGVLLACAAVTSPARAAETPAPVDTGQACVSTGPLASVAAGEAPFVRADVRAVAEQVTCYCGCPHLQVSKCFCGTAEAIRADFAARLDRGESLEAVLAAYVAEHGPSILAVPPRKGFHWIIWVGPPLLLILGAVLVAMMGRRWSRPGGAELAAVTLDPEQEARYRAAVERALKETR